MTILGEREMAQWNMGAYGMQCHFDPTTLAQGYCTATRGMGGTFPNRYFQAGRSRMGGYFWAGRSRMGGYSWAGRSRMGGYFWADIPKKISSQTLYTKK